MWIVTTNGFLSIVEDRDDYRNLQVRARVAEDITEHFPRAKVITMDGADYRYRAIIKRRVVASRLRRYVMEELDYDSHFKDIAIKTSPKNADRSSAYYSTWTAMSRMQDYAPYSRVKRSKLPLWGRFSPVEPRETYPDAPLIPNIRHWEEDDLDDMWYTPDRD